VRSILAEWQRHGSGVFTEVGVSRKDARTQRWMDQETSAAQRLRVRLEIVDFCLRLCQGLPPFEAGPSNMQTDGDRWNERCGLRKFAAVGRYHL